MSGAGRDTSSMLLWVLVIRAMGHGIRRMVYGTVGFGDYGWLLMFLLLLIRLKLILW